MQFLTSTLFHTHEKSTDTHSKEHWMFTYVHVEDVFKSRNGLDSLNEQVIRVCDGCTELVKLGFKLNPVVVQCQKDHEAWVSFL